MLRIGRVVGIVGAMALTVACGNDRSSAPSETAEPATPPPAPVASGLAPELLPDILIVVLDTTSPLAIASAMPNAAAFEAESRHFSRAVSPSNTTMEAVAGMMTGTWMSSARLWDEGFVTLSEALRDVGYSTFIGSSNPVLDHPFYVRGYGQTHVRLQDITPDFPDQGLLTAFEATWATMESPKMAWLQLAACHDYRIARKNYIDEGPAVGANQLREAWDAYVLDCAATDELLPRFFGANPDGVTVMTADHGELFGDRAAYAFPGQAEHGHGVSDSPLEIEVPLAIRGPGFTKGKADELVSTLDVRSTLLRMVGLETPGGDLRTGDRLTPPISASCDIYDVQTSHFSARVRPDGSHVVRSHGPEDMPSLMRWQPGGAGRRDVVALKPTEIDDIERRLLFGDAKLHCVSDRDLCAQHPELASLGYIDCP